MEHAFFTQLFAHDLTKTQTKIAQYIFKNQKRILGLTAKEAGAEIGVSDASIIRFARAVGFEGYTDMLQALEKELKSQREKIGKHSLFDRYALQMEKYPEEDNSTEESLLLMGLNLETSIRQNSEETYNRCIQRILRARRKVVIGLRGGQGPAILFSRILSHIFDHVILIHTEAYDHLCKLNELNSEDLVIMLSFPRPFRVDRVISSVLSEKKVPLILITDSMQTQLAKQADEVLLAETEHCGFFHSMIGVEALVEYLLIRLCRTLPENFRKKLQERDLILKNFLDDTK